MGERVFEQNSQTRILGLTFFDKSNSIKIMFQKCKVEHKLVLVLRVHNYIKKSKYLTFLKCLVITRLNTIGKLKFLNVKNYITSNKPLHLFN